MMTYPWSQAEAAGTMMRPGPGPGPGGQVPMAAWRSQAQLRDGWTRT